MPCWFAAGFGTFDKQDWPGGGDGAAHSLQHEAFRTFHIDFDKLRKAEFAGIDEVVDGSSPDAEFSSRGVVSMPDKAGRGRVLSHSNDCLARLI